MDNKLKLSGEDAKNFASSYFHPSKDVILNFNARMKCIDENVEIKRQKELFEACIKNLDLSFIKIDK